MTEANSNIMQSCVVCSGLAAEIEYDQLRFNDASVQSHRH